MSAVLGSADDLEIDVRNVDPETWDHGAAKGVYTRRNPMSARPLVEARERSNSADLARTLIHEYAHARLHFDIDDPDERAKREIEAEAVAYVVGRQFGLDTSNSAFYLAAWQDGESELIQERLSRISRGFG